MPAGGGKDLVAATSAYSGLVAMSSAWVPVACTCPASITMIRSAMVMVDSRCATTSTVVARAASAMVPQRGLVDRVQPRGRLLEQPGPARERQGDGDPLSVAAGQPAALAPG